MSGVGKALLLFAAVLAVVGLVFVLIGKGILPRVTGDLSFGRSNFKVFVPIGTSILLSLFLTLMLNLFLQVRAPTVLICVCR